MSNFVVVGFLTLLLQVQRSHLLYLRSSGVLNEAAVRVTCSGYSPLASKLMVAKQLHPLQGSLILKPQCDGGTDAYKPIIPVGKVFSIYYKGDQSLRCLFKKGTAFTLDIQVVAFGSIVVGTLTVSCPLKLVTAKLNPDPFPPYNLNYKSGSMPASVVGIKCNYDSSVDLTFLPQKKKKIFLVSCFKVKFTHTVEATAVKSRAVLDGDPFTNCVFRSDIPSVRDGATKWKRDAKTIQGIEVSIFDYSTLACEGTGVIVPCKPPPPTTTTTPAPTTEKFTTQKFTTQQWTTEGFTTEPTPEETTPGPTTTEDFPTEPSTTQTTRPTTSKATTLKATTSKPTTPKATTPKPTTPKATTPEPTTTKATSPKTTTPKATTPRATSPTPKPTTPRTTSPTPKPTTPRATSPTPKPTTPKATTPKPTTPKPTTPKATTPKATTPKPTTPKATTPEPTTPKATTPRATSPTPKPTTPKATTPKPTTPKATTPKPTTPKATTPKPTTPTKTTPKPTTPKATTSKPTTPKATTSKPTTPKATTPKPTTPKATTPKPTTPKATTPKPTTPKATTPKPTTPKATTPKTTTPKATTPKTTTPKTTTPKTTTPRATTPTPKPTTPRATSPTPKPTTPKATKATTPKPTTPKATTPKPTTPKPTTPKATTPKPTTPKATTPKPTTPKATTPKPTTPKVTTPKPTTPKPTTPKPTTPKATTPKPTTPKATTPKPTTPKATTPKPTTPKATTPKPTTPKATTPKATTPKPTTPKATTPKPTTPKATPPPPGFTLNKAAAWITCSGDWFDPSLIYVSEDLHPLHKLLVLRPSCRGGSDIKALPTRLTVYYTGKADTCLFQDKGSLYTIRFDVLAYGNRSIGRLDFHCRKQPIAKTPDVPTVLPPYPLRIIPNLIQNIDIDCSKKDSIALQLLPQRSKVVVALECQDSTKTYVVNNTPVEVKIWKKGADKRSKCVFRNDIGIEPGVMIPKLNVPVLFFKLADFSYLGTGSIEPCNENPDKFILDVSSHCGRSTSDAAWITGISDVDAEFQAVCKSGNVFKFDNVNGDRVNYRLPVQFKGDTSSKCVFNRKGNSQVYVITVKASWGEGSNLIHKSNREYQVTCVYGSRGSDDTLIQSISDRLIAAKSMQQNKGPDSVSTIQLDVVDVLGAPVTFMPQGRKVKLSARSKGEGRELGIRTIGCDAIGTKTKARYAVIRAGCGDGLIFKKNEGFTTNGLAATSPYFKVFAMRDDNLVKFECNFTMCATNCDGSSCSVSRRRRDLLEGSDGIEHAYTRTIRLL